MSAPFVPTRTAYLRRIIDVLGVRPNDVVYELGSGDGRFLLACAKAEPQASYIGVERNPLLHLRALACKWYAGNPSNVTFIRGDLFTTDLNNATHVYAYLLPSAMDRLLQKLEQECMNVRLASSAFVFGDKKPLEIVMLSPSPSSHGQNMLYLYEF